MKMIPFALFALFFLAIAPAAVRAQTNAPAAAAPGGPLSFLTHAQQMQYAMARAKALQDNPQLKAEGEEIIGERDHMMTDTDSADQQAYMEKMRMHRQKLREAMLKEDPTIQPVFDAIDKRLSELRAKAVDQAAASPNPASHPAPALKPSNP